MRGLVRHLIIHGIEDGSQKNFNWFIEDQKMRRLYFVLAKMFSSIDSHILSAVTLGNVHYHLHDMPR